MRIAAVLCSLCLFSPALDAQIVVGQGAPDEGLRSAFVNAYSRGSFAQLVTLPPATEVRRYGPTGLIQEFNSSGPTGRLALIKANTQPVAEGTLSIFQIHVDMFAYYGTVGVATAGYPTNDTTLCPGSSCFYQLFDKNYALFTYGAGANSPGNLTVKDPYYSAWRTAGGIQGLGPATSAEQTITSTSGVTAVVQTFSNGALYNITSGALSGRMLTVKAPIWEAYRSAGGHAGTLGLPTSDELNIANGRKRQTFEGGSFEYEPGSGPIIRQPVARVVLTPSANLRMNPGETVRLQATAYAADGTELTDRVINFITSNGRVASLSVNGTAVTVRAVGGGFATLTATAEGKSSTPISITVVAQCCQPGEGAPTAALQQLFADAVNRNQLAIRLPGANPVRRVASGYVQELAGTAAGVRYLLAVPDRSPQAWVVTGPILQRYESTGGVTGPLGYPMSDATPGGRQLFENGAIGGNPPQLVTGAFATRWSQSGFENGRAGSPTGEVTTLISSFGTGAQLQSFQTGQMYAATFGPNQNRAFLVYGLVLARYLSRGGPSGPLGLPITEEAAVSGRMRQEFEGGRIDYAPGDAEASVTERERIPLVTAVPVDPIAGTRVRLTVSGFPENSSLRVSQTGQADFVAGAKGGAYTWEAYIPANASSATIRIRAVDAANPALSAETTYRIRAASEIRAQIVKLRGDTQIGAPGSLLPIPLRVAVREEGSTPLRRIAVLFTASPGAQIAGPAQVLTNDAGEAEVQVRLPSNEGIALINAEALRQFTTFSVRSAGAGTSSFPRIQQSGSDLLGNGTSTIAQKGALLASVVSILRHYQNAGIIGSPNGLAELASVNQFLRSYCQTDYLGTDLCDGFVSPPGSAEQFVNLWRLREFAGTDVDVSVENPDALAVKDLAGQGTPILLALSMTADGLPAGAHFVVAIGVGPDGAVRIHDPDPAFARASLADYLDGFDAAGKRWKASISGAARLMVRSTGNGFLVTANEAISVLSEEGECGRSLSWPDTATVAGGSGAGSQGTFRQYACFQRPTVYQLDSSAVGPFRLTITDLEVGGARTPVSASGSISLKVSRPGQYLQIGTQDVTVARRGIVNPATFTEDIAPGGLAAIFGSGLYRAGGETIIEIGGRQAAIIGATPFQLNFQVPPELAPGSHVLRVTTPFGSAEQPVDIQLVAPAIFQSADGRGAILNQDGTANSGSQPALRGQSIVAFGTGFGAVSAAGGLSTVRTPVRAFIAGREVPVPFAGLAPGFIGLYQINVQIPVGTPPGLDLPLTLSQGAVESRPTEIAIQ